MVGLILSDPVPAFESPEDTADKLGSAWGRQIDWSSVQRRGAAQRGKPKPDPLASAALLDADEIEREHGAHTAYAPQWQMATFRIPLGIRWSQYEKVRDERAATWINAQAREGWDLCTDSRIVAKPGPYPAVDLHSGLKLLGEREVILMARFRQRAPQLFTWELPRDWFERPSE